MKRRDLIRHLEQHSCRVLREGKHTIYVRRKQNYTLCRMPLQRRHSNYRNKWTNCYLFSTFVRERIMSKNMIADEHESSAELKK